VIEGSVLVGGRYECGPVIGRGGMAEVRAGRDTRLDRPVAVKLLHPALALQPDFRRRFESEARLAARLVHPNIVAVFDSGEEGGVPYIVMERLPGRTLHDQLGEGPLSVGATHELASQVLAALGAAHGAGIIHRDIKPGNILCRAAGQWKLGDFGIAKILETQNSDQTATGLVVGTPAYLAPERYFGGDATVASDLYALGVVLYEALAGRKPFYAASPQAWPAIVAGTDPTPLPELRADAGPSLVAAIERSLAKDPADRFASATEMLVEIISPSATEPAPIARVGAELDLTRPLPTGERPARTKRLELAPTPRRRVAAAVTAVAAAAIVALVTALAVAAGSGGSANRGPSTTLRAPANATRLAPKLPAPTTISPSTSIPPSTVPPTTVPPTTVAPATTARPSPPSTAAPPPGAGHGRHHGKGGIDAGAGAVAGAAMAVTEP
jgi:serine/threonine protein kinase